MEKVEVKDLPEDWEAYKDEAGNVFYQNSVSGVSQWEVPKLRSKLRGAIALMAGVYTV